ncbi:MAG: 4-hydroxy-tetrahydrodipicolinate synthase [Pseudomonadota bacterium]
MFSGALTALVTPMSGGKVDVKNLEAFVEFQISEGINGLVPCGTTGEGATLIEEEHSLVVRTVVKQARKRVPVIAGAGANSTAKAIRMSKLCAEAGADALLHVTPFYNKPTPQGLVAHFKAISEAVDLPIVAYNVPGRTGCDMQPDTVAQLAQIPRVVGVKEATGSMIRGAAIIAACGSDFDVLSGDDGTCMTLTALGGAGVISVVSNLVPRLTAGMIAATRDAKMERAREIHYKLRHLIDLLFIESNPIPVKAGVSLIGYGANEVRLPLVPFSGPKLNQLKEEMTKLGLL